MLFVLLRIRKHWIFYQVFFFIVFYLINFVASSLHWRYWSQRFKHETNTAQIFKTKKKVSATRNKELYFFLSLWDQNLPVHIILGFFSPFLLMAHFFSWNFTALYNCISFLETLKWKTLPWTQLAIDRWVHRCVKWLHLHCRKAWST